jgi:hypothetical protein
MTTEIIDDPFGIYEFDESAQELHEAVYATIQWHNGQQSHKKSPGIMGKGGFFINSREQRKAASLPNWAEDEIVFESGDSETGPATTRERMAFIRSRRCWQHKEDGRVMYSHWNDYAKGKTGKQQWIVAVEGCSEIFVLSVKGTTGMAIEAALNEHSKKVVSAARTLAKKNLPPYAFWIELTGGEFAKVGQGNDSSWVTPPRIVLPEQIDRNFLVKSFVGQENLTAFQQAFKEAETWAQRWSSANLLRQINSEMAPEPLGATDARVERATRAAYAGGGSRLIDDFSWHAQPDDYNDDEPDFR